MDDKDAIAIAQDLAELEFWRAVHEHDIGIYRNAVVHIRTLAHDKMIEKIARRNGEVLA